MARQCGNRSMVVIAVFPVLVGVVGMARRQHGFDHGVRESVAARLRQECALERQFLQRPFAQCPAVDADMAGFQMRNFLARSPEQDSVAALQSDDVLALARKLQHERVDVLLTAGRAVAALTNEHSLGVRSRERQDLLRNQRIEENDICLLHRAHSLERQKLRITRPCSDQRDAAPAPLNAVETALASAWSLMILLISGRHDPQLVPACVASPTDAIVQQPLRTASQSRWHRCRSSAHGRSAVDGSGPRAPGQNGVASTQIASVPASCETAHSRETATGSGARNSMPVR